MLGDSAYSLWDKQLEQNIERKQFSVWVLFAVNTHGNRKLFWAFKSNNLLFAKSDGR